MYDLDNFPDEAVPLIEIDEANNVILNQDAVKILQKIDTKLCVVAVAGLYRTGKSSLINWILQRQAGFQVGSTVQACTRGIWLWGKPKEHILESGEKVLVLMLDTEGLGGLESSQQYDARIFSLATLLCSKLIYNSLGSINENAIGSLSFVANLTKHIRVKANSDQYTGEELKDFFPSFMWVVRDFTLELVDEDGDPISSNDYLEKALELQTGFGKATMERNRVRSMMTSFFQDRSCMTLVRPMNDEVALQRVDKQSIDNFRPEFVDQLSALREKIFEDLIPKRLQNKELTGSMFVSLVNAYVNAINSGGVPTIFSAWDWVTLGECRNAMQDALSKFKSLLVDEVGTEKLPLDNTDLLSVTSNAADEARKSYMKLALGPAAAKFKDELNAKMGHIVEDLKTRNSTASKNACEVLLQARFSEILQPILNPAEGEIFADVLAFSERWAAFRDEYFVESRGPEKYRVMCDFTEKKMTEAMQLLLAEKEKAFQGKLEVEEKKIADSLVQLSKISAKAEKYRNQIEVMQAESAELLADRSRLEAETERQDRMITQLNEKVRSGERGTQQIELEKTQRDQRIEEEISRNTSLEGDLTRLKQEVRELRSATERQELEIGMLSDENDSLRKGGNCSCVIS